MCIKSNEYGPKECTQIWAISNPSLFENKLYDDIFENI